MIVDELYKLVNEIINRKSESQYIEIKKAHYGTPEKLYDTLSSFSNQYNGGIIIFGIDEKNNYEICGVYDVQDLQIKITQQANQMIPIVRPVFTVAEYSGKYVVSAEISECDTNDKPCYYSGAGKLRGSYIRVGESDEKLTEYEIYNYDAYKKKIREELRVVENSSLNDFNKEELNQYFYCLKKVKKNINSLDDNKILALQGLINDDKPTVAGLMILGLYPQAYFPQLSITAMAIDGYNFGDIGRDKERFIDNKRFDGNISYMLEETLAFIRRNTYTKTIINQNGVREDRTEYPMIAVREIILNALIHRDYSVYSEDCPIRVIIYKDRLEVENPGGLYGRITLKELGTMPSDTRNPFIASNLEILMETENRFSGIPTIRQEMAKYEMEPPVFESRKGQFKVTLYNLTQNNELNCNYLNYDPIQEKILEFCIYPRSREEIAKALNIDSEYYIVTKYLKPLIELNLIKMTIPNKPKSKNQRFYSDYNMFNN